MSYVAARLRLDVPDDAKATLSITMSVRDWRELSSTLKEASDRWPMWQFRAAVADVLLRADQSLFSTEETKAGE